MDRFVLGATSTCHSRYVVARRRFAAVISTASSRYRHGLHFHFEIISVVVVQEFVDTLVGTVEFAGLLSAGSQAQDASNVTVRVQLPDFHVVDRRLTFEEREQRLFYNVAVPRLPRQGHLRRRHDEAQAKIDRTRRGIEPV